MFNFFRPDIGEMKKIISELSCNFFMGDKSETAGGGGSASRGH